MRENYKNANISLTASLMNIKDNSEIDISSILAPRFYNIVEDVDELRFERDDVLSPDEYANIEEYSYDWLEAFEPFKKKLLDAVNRVNSKLEHCRVVAEIDEYADTLTLFAIYDDDDDYDNDCDDDYNDYDYDDDRHIHKHDCIDEDVLANEFDVIKQFFKRLKRNLSN